MSLTAIACFLICQLSLTLFRSTLEMSYGYGKRRLATLYALCFMSKGTSLIGMVPHNMSYDYSLSPLELSQTIPYKVWRIC